MGREWYRGGSRSSRKGDANVDTETPSHGCMTAFRHIFDFHPLHCAMNQNSAPVKPDSAFPAHLEGIHQLRDRLQSEDASAALAAPLPSISEDMKIQMGIRIKTRKEAKAKAKTEADFKLCSETISSSPRTKPPNLVARLMGLDLLPEDLSSPSLSHVPCNSQQLHHHLVNGRRIRPINHRHSHRRSFLQQEDVCKSRSLPETPRISAERKSDVEHRLSLQINNKENISSGEEIFIGRRNLMDRAKERRLGDDLTNTIRRSENREKREYRCTKCSKKSISTICSPKLGFAESRYREQYPQSQHRKSGASIEKQSPVVEVSYEPKLRRQEKEQVMRKANHRLRFGQRTMKKPPQALEVQVRNKEEQFRSERKCKKIPLSKQQVINPKTVVSIRKEPLPNTPPHQQHQLHTHETFHQLVDRHEQENHIVEHTPISIHNFSSQVPNPSIIDHFQRSSIPATAPPNLIHECNQKFMIDLIDEIMGSFSKPWTTTRRSVSAKLGNFPSSDCAVREDIDALIGWDLSHPMVQPWKRDYDDEWEAIFVEIEKGIVDWLVHETAAGAAATPSYGLRGEQCRSL